MCLIAFSYKNHIKYELVFLANRDEFYERPTRAAGFWDEYPELLAGKDLKAGGTWMGINKSGEFSALTNYRDMDMRKEDPPSRGHLVLNFLTSSDEPEQYLKKVDSEAHRFDGFNLIVGNLDDLSYYTNKTNNIQRLNPGVHGLSNHLLDTPWPKVTRAKQELAGQLQFDTIDEQALFDILKNDIPAPDPELPDTGIPRELERAVSPIFIKTDRYGTRCSTILLVDKNGEVIFEERRYKPGTTQVDETNRYEFRLEK